MSLRRRIGSIVGAIATFYATSQLYNNAFAGVFFGLIALVLIEEMGT